MNASPAQFEDIKLLETKLKNSQLPPDLYKKAAAFIERLVRLTTAQGYSNEYDSVSRYLDWIIALPWTNRSQDILSIDNAKKTLDANHFGLENIKERILEYISVANLKQSKGEKVKAPALLLIGLVGTGKTTMAYSIAQALARQFGRIPMGGMGDAIQLRGRARAYPDSEPGQVMKVLRRVQTKNPVILLDEIDRVTEEARADIMGVLVELLDPNQNDRYVDHFIDNPVDLSEVLFVATGNNTSNVATADMDRLEPIMMPSYTDAEKIKIAEDYLLPKAVSDAGLDPGTLTIDPNLWPTIVRPFGYDAGIRTLNRTISGITSKVARLVVEGQASSVHLTPDNIKQFLPKY